MSLYMYINEKFSYDTKIYIYIYIYIIEKTDFILGNEFFIYNNI